MLKKHEHTVEVSFKGYELEVTGIYTPGEDEVRYPVDSAYPGSSPKFDIKKVKMIGADSDVVPSDVNESELEDYILDKEFSVV